MVKRCPISLWGVSLSRLLPRRNLSYNWRTKKTSFLLCLHFCSLLCPSAPVPCELFSGRRIWLKPDMCFLLKTLCTQTEKGMGGYHITLSTVDVPIHLISTQAFNFHSPHVSVSETVFVVTQGGSVLVITRFAGIIQQCVFHLSTVIFLKPRSCITCCHGNTQRPCSERWRMIVRLLLRVFKHVSFAPIIAFKSWDLVCRREKVE